MGDVGEIKPAALKPLRLRCSVKNYDWGRLGEDSMVARLFSKNSNAEIEPGRPYAEFWMGTHDSGPSFVAAGVQRDEPSPEPVTLKEWISENPGVLGEKVAEKWGGDLPFLFKVLSVAKALSIQAHPDKESAKMLHKRWPSIYKDANHKPEMAVALTEFKALCGFVSAEELKDVLTSVPEIKDLVGSEDANKITNGKQLDGHVNVKKLLQLTFTKLMLASKDAVSEAVSRLKYRLNVENKRRNLTEKEQLVLLLEKQYPADVGVISAFFFNLVKLSPGEALYIGANEPHAYISGDCIECMATSDNVVRAGLTPKYRDVETLCSLLTYKQGFPDILQPIPLSDYVSRYTPPYDEFEVDLCSLPPRMHVVFPTVPGPSVIVIVSGEGRMQIEDAVEEEVIMEGHVYFVPAQCAMSVTASDVGPLQLYRAGVNSRFLD